MTARHVVLGTGAIGRAIAEELVKRGESVRMVNRSGRMEEVPTGVEVVASDLYDPARVKEVTRGARVVYQAAQPRYDEWTEKFPSLQKSIMEGLTDNGAKLVIVENAYMYGDTNGSTMTEDTAYDAHTRKGRVRAEMSEAAFTAHREGRVRVTAGRGGDFFGPWGTDSTMGERVFYPLLRGKPAQLIGRTDLPGGSMDELYRSLARVCLPLDDSTVVLSGHGPQTTIGQDRRKLRFMETLPGMNPIQQRLAQGPLETCYRSLVIGQASLKLPDAAVANP